MSIIKRNFTLKILDTPMPSRINPCVVLALFAVGMFIAVTGDVSADTDTPTASHQRMLTLLKGIADQIAETNNYLR